MARNVIRHFAGSNGTGGQSTCAGSLQAPPLRPMHLRPQALPLPVACVAAPLSTPACNSYKSHCLGTAAATDFTEWAAAAYTEPEEEEAESCCSQHVGPTWWPCHSCARGASWFSCLGRPSLSNSLSLGSGRALA